MSPLVQPLQNLEFANGKRETLSYCLMAPRNLTALSCFTPKYG